MNAARRVAPGAGKPADPATLVDIPRLMTAYYTRRPDASVPQQPPVTPEQKKLLAGSRRSR